MRNRSLLVWILILWWSVVRLASCGLVLLPKQLPQSTLHEPWVSATGGRGLSEENRWSKGETCLFMGLRGPAVVMVVVGVFWGPSITVEAWLVVVQVTSPSVWVRTAALPVERLPGWVLRWLRVGRWMVGVLLIGTSWTFTTTKGNQVWRGIFI